MSGILHDVRYAARSLGRVPWFTAVAAGTLGIGMGVLTALFAVVQAVLLDPIVPNQHQVVRIWKDDVERGEFRHPLTYEEFRSFRSGSRTLSAVAALQTSDASTLVFTIDDQRVPADVMPVSADFFALVQAAPPRHGRWFTATDEAKGADFVGVVSERFWRQVAGGDPAFVGRRLAFAAGSAAGIAGGARTMVVIGIAPAELDYPLGTDIWVPIASFFDGVGGRFNFDDRGFAQFELLARAGGGASPEEIRAELDVLQRPLVTQFPDDYLPMRIVVQPLVDSVVGNARQILMFLLAAAGLVVAIAGVNVAALLLMRAAVRRRERAVRIALGASRWRLARETLTESALLAGGAALAGSLLAFVLLAAVHRLAPADLPRVQQASLDFRVIGCCVLSVVVWVLTLGTAPVWTGRGADVARAGDLALRGRPRTAGLRLFTVVEIAAAVVVAVGAALLVRSFVHLQRVDRGFDATNLAVFSILIPDDRYPDPPRRVAFFDALLPAIESIPGVVAATPVHMNPGSGAAGLSSPMRFEGQTPDDAATNPWATWEPVTPSYFRTLGVAIVEGRALLESDNATAARVAVVSQSVARRYWPGESAIGKKLQLASEFGWVTVVGVARDLRYRELTKDWMTVYFPAAQLFFFAPSKLIVRTASGSAAIAQAVGERLREKEPAAAVTSVQQMDTLLAFEFSRPRVALAVTSLFALVAMLLAAVGAYSVMAYDIAQRRHELAVRAALGATPARLVAGVVRESALLGAAGAFAGILTAALLTRYLESLLFQVKPADPRAFAIGAASLLALVLAAAALPARRAAGTDPAAVLRTD